MEKSEILEAAQEIFRDVMDNENLVITWETTADDVDEWDSLSHINLIMAIEKEFNINFALGELQTLKNVGDLLELSLQKIG